MHPLNKKDRALGKQLMKLTDPPIPRRTPAVKPRSFQVGKYLARRTRKVRWPHDG